MRFRLSLMMGLIYAVQGAFWPLLAVHLTDLGINARARGMVFATLAVGSMVMPLGAGQVVDRLMSGQRLLALVFATASLCLTLLATGLVTSAVPLIGLFLIFWMIAAPGFALTNTIALRHLRRPREQFASVRLWGTFGWIAAGWCVSFVMVASGSSHSGKGVYEAFWVSAALALGLAAYSLTLPDTPPLARSDSPSQPGHSPTGLAGALALGFRPGMPVLLSTALGVHMTTGFVYQVLPSYLAARGMPRAGIAWSLSLGQWPEILMLAGLPWMFRRVGTKATLAVGIGAWVVRYAALGLNLPVWATVAGMPLHGVGIACFTVAGQVVTDGQASRELRASAQALYLVATAGLGALLGSILAGEIAGRFAADSGLVFFVPCVIDAALLVYFCAGYRASARPEECAGASLAARPLRHDAARSFVARVGNLVTESADG